MAAQLWNRNVVLFVSVTVLSGFGGTAMTLVASIWVLDLTGSAALAALIAACLYAPSIFGPALGSVVDRLPRRGLLVWTCALTAGSLVTLLAMRSPDQLWLLFTVMFGYGIAHVLLDAGESALLPASVDGSELGQINGWRMSIREGMKLVAPLAGAGLFTWKGGGVVAVVVAGLLLASAGLYRLVRPGRADPVPAEGSGVKYLWSRPRLRAIVLVAAIAVAMSGVSTAAQFAFITDDLARPAAFAAILASAQGAGSIVSGLAAGRLMRLRGEAFLGGLGSIVFAVGMVTRFVASSWLAVAGSVLIGIGLPWTVVAAMTFIQRHVDDAMLGRVAGTAGAMIFVPTAIALPLGAGIVVFAGQIPAYLFTVTVCLVAPLLLRARMAAC